MNITQLKKDGYKVFSRQKNGNKEANIVALQYIESLASRTGTNITSWDLEELFGSGSDRREYDFIKDKNELNKRFFTQEARLRESTDVEAQHIKSLIGTRAKEIADRRKQNQIASFTQSYEGQMQRVAEYYRGLASTTATAYGIWTQIQQLRERPETLDDEVLAVLRDTFWKFRDFNGALVLYETRADVILGEVNPAAGLNYQVNLGRFIAEVNIENMQTRVYPVCTLDRTSPAVNVDGYYHPHLNQSGAICWGDAGARAAAHQTKGELAAFMHLLASLLSTYSAHAPYRSLIKFDAMSKAINRDRTEIASAIGEVQDGQTPNFVLNTSALQQLRSSLEFNYQQQLPSNYVLEGVHGPNGWTVTASSPADGRFIDTVNQSRSTAVEETSEEDISPEF